MKSFFTSLDQKAKSNSEHHIIYLFYGDEEQEINPLPYKKYGITDIIKVNQKTIIELYEFIYTISKKIESLNERDSIQEYTNIEFEYLDKKNNENIDIRRKIVYFSIYQIFQQLQ